MRELHVLRHFKAEPGGGVPDRQRALSPGGRRAAGAVAGLVDREGIRPQLVLCSPSLRTRESLALLEPAVGTPEVRLEEAVYGGGPDDVLDVVRGVDDAVSAVMVVGHNPTLHDLVLHLLDPEDSLRVASGYPAGALATLGFDLPWADLDRGSARLVRFLLPRDA